MIDQLIYSRSQSLNGLSHLLPATESSHFLRIPHDTRSFFPSRMLWLSWTILSIFLAVASGNTSPQFHMNSSFTLPEDTPIKAWVFQLVAVDAEGDTLTYSLEGVYAYYFSVNSESGNVTLEQTVDYEQRKVIILDAGVTDGKSVKIYKKITIIIEDRNDNKPIFQKEPYFTDVLENTRIGSPIYTVLAMDMDTGNAGRVSYTIEEVNPNDAENHWLFYILYNGTVVLNGSLSYNNKSTFYRIKILATDHGGQLNGKLVYQNNTAYLSVTVVDVADLDPIFLGAPYTSSVPENCTLGTSVVKVLAIDQDSNVNDIIYYNITSATSLFTIDTITGVITVSGPLDREGVPGEEVQLQVVAQEKNLNVYQEVAQVITTVTIQVTDINDNKPQFYMCSTYPTCNITDPQGNFFGDIEEHASARTPVAGLNIVAYDSDKGSNGTFQLSLQGPDSFAFSVLPMKIVNEGTVQVLVSNSSLVDYEKTPHMTVQIVANDTGRATDCCSFATVTITLTDINDHRPEFNQSEYKLYVLEESPPGTIVSSNITATDPDSGKYGEITYYLLPQSIQSTFTVNATSGVVLVVNGTNLDWGVRPVYYATLQAVDGGGLSGSTQLEITVVDINNKPPVVTGSYNVFVTEGENSTVHIQATDQDDPETNNSRLLFEIVPGDFSSYFTIDPVTGVLSSKSPLDREAIPVELKGKMEVTVLVHDLGIPQLNATVNVTFIVEDINDNAPRFNSSFYDFFVQEGFQETLRILIVDVNDNPPVFLQSTNTFVIIPEISPMDLQVAVVKATDDDTGANGVITFAISRVLFIPDTGPHQTLENLFKVVTTADKNVYTGSIQVASNLDSSLKGRYQVMVEAKDHGVPLLNSSVSLDIYTVDQSYRVRLVFTSSLQTVQAKSDEIKASLSTATQTTVYIANIKLIEGSETSRSDRAMSKTAMEAYFVYSNGTALMAGQVRVLIQRNPEEMSRLINLGLSIIGPVEVTESNKVLELLGIIAGLAGAVVLILIVMILIITGMRKSYVRKLKALQALKVASKFSPAEVKQGPAIPGTNKYNTEGANPVLGLSLYPSLDLEENTSFEVASLNSLDENMVDAPENAPVAPAPKHKADARYQANGWKEPLKAALESHNKDKPEQLGHLKNKSLTFENPSLDTTDL
ncbi:cadherin-related family member 2 isoform X4 [Rhineura floridana]|uniref:cadherin-related family member 2 isoform X4 n=1 Tax=Rhineura floridana TaxID=261503 RepID=UPI002AC82696|nr:cadherin-related family member 2 isoform X4 [Rhineura floridana]